MRLACTLGLAAIGCDFTPGELRPDSATPDVAMDVSEQAASCRDITGASGTYTINLAGAPTEVLCEQSVDGGGWTLIASFVNNDGVRNWSTIESLQNGSPSFGQLANREAGDYKSPAYGTVAGTDLMGVTEEYAFSFHGLLGNQTFSTFMTVRWPSSCSTTWLREGASFTSGLTSLQASLLGVLARAQDTNEGTCFPNEESSALAFLAGDLQNNGLGNAPASSNAWGTVDHSLPNLANFTRDACAPPAYPCNTAGGKKLWDNFGPEVKARRILMFVR